MTCNDCIHHDLCFDNGTLFLRYAKGIDKENAETKCPFDNFKNKADFVEVVRCKDCRNRIEKNWAKCAGRKPDDFCSDGIRRFK